MDLSQSRAPWQVASLKRQSEKSLAERLQELEDRLSIYQLVCGYGYAVDGCNAEAIGSLYSENGVYAVGDVGSFEGRDRIAGIADERGHRERIAAGCGHLSTLPYVVIDGDRATATCHTMVIMRGKDGFHVDRLSASRLELSRQPDGQWRIDHRQNYPLDGDAAGPALLARLREGPTV